VKPVECGGRIAKLGELVRHWNVINQAASA
jgi:hypothetical protein